MPVGVTITRISGCSLAAGHGAAHLEMFSQGFHKGDVQRQEAASGFLLPYTGNPVWELTTADESGRDFLSA